MKWFYWEVSQADGSGLPLLNLLIFPPFIFFFFILPTIPIYIYIYFFFFFFKAFAKYKGKKIYTGAYGPFPTVSGAWTWWLFHYSDCYSSNANQSSPRLENILGFAGHRVFVTTTQPWCFSLKRATNGTSTNKHGCIPITLFTDAEIWISCNSHTHTKHYSFDIFSSHLPSMMPDSTVENLAWCLTHGRSQGYCSAIRTRRSLGNREVLCWSSQINSTTSGKFTALLFTTCMLLG